MYLQNIRKKFAKNLRNICEKFAKYSQKIREKFVKNSQKIREKLTFVNFSGFFHEFFANILQILIFRKFFANFPRIFREYFANISQIFRKFFANFSQIFREFFATDHVKSPQIKVIFKSYDFLLNYYKIIT